MSLLLFWFCRWYSWRRSTCPTLSREKYQLNVTILQQELRAVTEMKSDDIKLACADTGFGSLAFNGLPDNASGNQFLRVRMNLDGDNDILDASALSV